MSNPIVQAGGLPDQSKFAPIHTNRFFTGLWTQRNPLRDAATPFLYEKFYSGSRFDSLIGGSNVELSAKMTLGRRAGHSVYNNQTFPAITRFYPWRYISGSSETIKMMIDTANTVYDGTGPSTKTAIFTKTGGAGTTSFLGVGTILFMGNGIDTVKYSIANGQTQWGSSAPVTAPTLDSSTMLAFLGGHSYGGDAYFVDNNGNFQDTTGAVTAPFLQPNWNTVLAGLTFGTYKNMGPAIGWQPNTIYQQYQWIIDPNGHRQSATTAGTSGATRPTFNTGGGTTTDGTVTWTDGGVLGTPIVKTGYLYGYAYHFKDGGVSNMSPLSQVGRAYGSSTFQVKVTGLGSARADCDFIFIFRTTDGGATLLYVDKIANPGASNFTYTDTTADSGLNQLLQGAINLENSPPPAGLTNLCYHLNIIFGSVGATVYWTRVASALAGLNLECFPPANSTTFPSFVTRLVPTAIGLLVFTTSDLYIIYGSNTASNPLYPKRFLEGLGLLDYDALSVAGTTIYMMTSDNQVISLDPGAGNVEIGFPIGDQFASLYNPANCYVTWHVGGSAEKALFVGDGAIGYFRMMQAPAPESGAPVWSPRASIVGGCSAILSVETIPGTHKLLVGPASSGPILQRDTTVNKDNGSAFAAFAQIGSITLAHHSQIAEIASIGVDAVRVGARTKVGVLFGEISGTFRNIRWTTNDPPLLPASLTTWNDRYDLLQSNNPVYCRHLQLQFTWAAEDAHNELLAYTIIGAVHQEQTS